MSQEIAQLKATVEQLKAGQEQMAQQIARDRRAKPAVIRTSPAKPAQTNTAQAKPSDTNWRAKVTAALPPRPGPAAGSQPATGLCNRAGHLLPAASHLRLAAHKPPLSPATRSDAV